MGQVIDGLFCTKAGGLSMLEELEQMNKDLNILIAEGEKRSQQQSEIERRLSSLEKLIGSSNAEYLAQRDTDLDLAIAKLSYSEGYLSNRKRFLAVYKSDLEGIEMNKDSKTTPKGNYSAHGVDALGDAVLFHRDRRTDWSTYRRLYGLGHGQVLDFSANKDGSLFLVLNAYATILAKGKQPSDDLKLAFDTFCGQVEEYWLQSPKGDPGHPLDLAYDNFWKGYNQQKYSVDA